MKKLLLIFVFGLAVLNVNANAAFAADWKYVQTTYTVQPGDSLDDIAARFMALNTYGKREIKEFTAGIKEANPWLLKRSIEPGDVLHINYWKN